MKNTNHRKKNRSGEKIGSDASIFSDIHSSTMVQKNLVSKQVTTLLSTNYDWLHQDIGRWLWIDAGSFKKIDIIQKVIKKLKFFNFSFFIISFFS